MKNPVQLTKAINPVRHSPYRSPLGRGLPRVQPIWIIRGFLLILLLLACFALSPTARAVTPAPDGGYPNSNTAEGQDALFSLTIGGFNTAIGFHALHNNTEGNGNTATGDQALLNNTIGGFNTANGVSALQHNIANDNTATGADALANNTIGGNNTANGSSALAFNTHGHDNTATGYNALEENTGSFNTANGTLALVNNTTGHDNTANGYFALGENTTGNNNTAIGYEALFGQYNIDGAISTGSNNTANGYRALYSYTTGHDNVANGVNALLNNTTGSFNTANGRGALNKNSTASNNTADGYQALNANTGSNNIAVGTSAGINLTTGDNNVDIGNKGVAGEGQTIRIGTAGLQNVTYISGISGVTVPSGVGVIIDSGGHLGTIVSSERSKDAIKPMDKASEAILALKPVTFRYKKELDPAGIPQFGLVAEEVEKVNPALVARDDHGKVYTVRYEAVNAMLLNEFLKEHRAFLKEQRKVEAQEVTIAQLTQDFQSKLAEQQKQIKALTSGLEKVSAQLEVSRSAPRTVLNNQ